MVKSCQQSVNLYRSLNHSANCCSNAYGFKSEPIFGTLHDGTVLILFYYDTQYTAEAEFETGSKGKICGDKRGDRTGGKGGI